VRVTNDEYVSDYLHVRGYCTCPSCRAIWTHFESGRAAECMRSARTLYGRPHPCPLCGQWSRPHQDQGLWDRFRTTRREWCAPPETVGRPVGESGEAP
jgi:hypothetical protein